MRAITIEVDRDSMGCQLLTPVSDKIRCKIMYYMKSVGVDCNGTAMIQNDHDIESWCADFMPAQKIKDLNRGWSQRIRVDAWAFLHLFGWDCHALAETGELWK
jgi:hypothetical protein